MNIPKEPKVIAALRINGLRRKDVKKLAIEVSKAEECYLTVNSDGRGKCKQQSTRVKGSLSPGKLHPCRARS